MHRITGLGLFVAAWMSQLLGPTLALNDTINVTVGTGTTKTANLIAFGSGNVISEVGICDATTANQCAVVSAAGAVKVDGSAVTQPVSGTVTANAGTGTMTVTGAGGTFPVTGTFFQATQPVSAVSLPLPTGAMQQTGGSVTANAGTNLNTSALATQTTLASVLSTLGSPFQAGASIGNTTFAATQATAASLNATVVGTGTFAVQAAATLNAETTKVIGTVNQGTSPWVISGALTSNQSVNVSQINGVTPLMGNGVTGTGSPRVTIASDNTAFGVNATVANGADVALGSTTDDPASCSLPLTASACTISQDLKNLVNIANSPATFASQYPVGAVPLTASATGTTGATTATLAASVSGKTTYICGYSIRANATAATTVTNTITGVITATLSSTMWVAPAASGLGIDEQIFMPCIPASATNTGIAIVSGAPGSGGVVSSKGWGYQL